MAIRRMPRRPAPAGGLLALDLASGKPGEFEARLRRHDGVDRWFLFRGVPQYDDRGSVVKWYGQTTDIEDRKRAEEELKQQTAHLDELFELAPHAVVLVDADVRVMRVNREFTRMFGYTAEEAVHRPLLDLVAPEERLRGIPEQCADAVERAEGRIRDRAQAQGRRATRTSP